MDDCERNAHGRSDRFEDLNQLENWTENHDKKPYAVDLLCLRVLASGARDVQVEVIASQGVEAERKVQRVQQA
jgi:hypothetical protein